MILSVGGGPTGPSPSIAVVVVLMVSFNAHNSGVSGDHFLTILGL